VSSTPPIPVYAALSRDELKAIITEAIVSGIPAIIAASQKPQRLEPEAFAAKRRGASVVRKRPPITNAMTHCEVALPMREIRTSICIRYRS
jgi:hypothetical protein